VTSCDSRNVLETADDSYTAESVLVGQAYAVLILFF
jgi:hypothetical protein